MDGLKEEFTQKEADKLFNDLLECGVIDEREDGDYGIPIPSLHTWLIANFGRRRGKGGGRFSRER